MTDAWKKSVPITNPKDHLQKLFIKVEKTPEMQLMFTGILRKLIFNLNKNNFLNKDLRCPPSKQHFLMTILIFRYVIMMWVIMLRVSYTEPSTV